MVSEPSVRFSRRPVAGPITQSFGDDAFSGYPHRGVDFGVPEGTRVFNPATRPGVVAQFTNSYAQWNGETVRAFGNGVCIDHGDGWWSLYAHLSRVDVVVGQVVQPGDLLGLSGNTGMSTGPHLHWQLSDSPAFPTDIAQSRDPLAYLEEPMTRAERGLINIAWGDFGRALSIYRALRQPGIPQNVRDLLPDEGIETALANGQPEDDLNAAIVMRGRLMTLATSDVADLAYQLVGG